jgi:hypothetical protein
MWGLIGIAGLVVVTVAACDRPIPVALNAPPPTPYPTQYGAAYPPPPVPAQYPAPAPTPVMVQAPAPSPPPNCTETDAAQIIAINRTLAGSNDPCVVYWRSTHVQQHPERAFDLECNGMKAYPDPQPPGHPVPFAECDRKTREDQARWGLPVKGLGEDFRATYRATWGHD